MDNPLAFIEAAKLKLEKDPAAAILIVMDSEGQVAIQWDGDKHMLVSASVIANKYLIDNAIGITKPAPPINKPTLQVVKDEDPKDIS